MDRPDWMAIGNHNDSLFCVSNQIAMVLFLPFGFSSKHRRCVRLSVFDKWVFVLGGHMNNQHDNQNGFPPGALETLEKAKQRAREREQADAKERSERVKLFDRENG